MKTDWGRKRRGTAAERALELAVNVWLAAVCAICAAIAIMGVLP